MPKKLTHTCEDIEESYFIDIECYDDKWELYYAEIVFTIKFCPWCGKKLDEIDY